MKFRTKKYHIPFWIFQSEMWYQNPMRRSLTWSPHNGSAPWSYIPRSPVVNGIQIRNPLMTSVLPYCWSADTVSPVQSFDLLASGTLFVIFFYFFFLSCQGRWPCRVCSHAHRNTERLPCLLPLFNYWTFVTISISQWLITFDITNQGTLPLVESCSGTKMPLMCHQVPADSNAPVLTNQYLQTIYILFFCSNIIYRTSNRMFVTYISAPTGISSVLSKVSVKRISLYGSNEMSGA